MTPTRWLIVAFWAVLILVGLKFAFDAIMAPPPVAVPEKHWFAPSLPSASAARSPSADVRMTHYTLKQLPGSSTFQVDVTVQNFGQKKATGVQLKVAPYVSNDASSNSMPGMKHAPDEIDYHPGGDPMANVFQYVIFPDLGPGESSTQTLTLTERSDADPAESQPKAKVEFQTAP